MGLHQILDVFVALIMSSDPCSRFLCSSACSFGPWITTTALPSTACLMYSEVSSRGGLSTMGLCGARAGLSGPAALLLLPSPHQWCLFMLRKLVAYHSHLMQLFEDVPWVPKCWMASFHLIWFIEIKCIIRSFLPMVSLLKFFTETPRDIPLLVIFLWIQDTGLYFVSSSCPGCSQESINFCSSLEELGLDSEVSLYHLESLHGRRGRLSFPSGRGSFPSCKHCQGIAGLALVTRWREQPC